MGVSVNDIVKIMVTQARTSAGNAWQTAGPIIESEFKNFGQQLAQIAAGVATGEMTQDDAKDFLAVLRNNMVAAIAMAVNIGQAALQQIINAALAAAKDAINAFVKFPLILA
jgi:Asp-tRNA(Asn)/Glu-tRNA(Gln) amidotransferase B subunit